MATPRWHKFTDAAQMAVAAATHVEAVIGLALRERGRATLAIAGGKTPIPVFERLARTAGIDWTKVTLLPTDDRLVDPHDDLSNVGLIRSWFGDTGARILSLTQPKRLDRDSAEDGAEQALRGLEWPIDLLWLGMGGDGHTGSILPGPDFDRAASASADRLAVAVTPDPLPPEAPVSRVTLTASAMARTRSTMLTIAGSAKLDVLERALTQGDAADTAIGIVLARTVAPVNLFWSA